MFLAVAVGLGQLQNGERRAGRIDPVSRMTLALVTPVTRLIDDTDASLRASVDNWSRGPALRAELDRLRQQEWVFQQYGAAEESLANELDQTRGLLGLPNFGKKPLPARIIGYAPMSHRMTLNVGQGRGVKAGQAVVSFQGLLGLVQTVDRGTCQVLLVTSSACKFGAMVQRNPEVPGLAKGQTPTRILLDVLETGKVDVGDRVVTSGYSPIIPRGIVVGTVAEVVQDPSYGTRRIFVAPAARVGRSLEVMVLR